MSWFRVSWSARHWALIAAAMVLFVVVGVVWTRDRPASTEPSEMVDCGQLREELHRLSGSVRALDGATGHVLWQAASGWTDSRPSVGQRQVVVTGTDFSGPETQVASIDVERGAVKWRHGLGRARPQRPLPVGDLILVPLVHLTPADGPTAASAPTAPPTSTASSGGRDEAMDRSPDADRVSWSVVVLDGATGTEVQVLPYRVLGFPDALAAWPDGTAVLGRDRHVALVDLRSGAERWSYDLESPNADPPTIVEGVVILRDLNRALYGLDLATGRPVWRRVGAPTTRLADNRGDRSVPALLVLTDDSLSALDARTGEDRWKVATTVTAEVYVGGDGAVNVVTTPPEQPFGTQLLAIELADGSVRWRVDAGAPVAPRLARSDRLVAALVGDPAALVAYDRTSGAERWRVDAADSLGSSLVFVGGRFVTATESGEVRAVSLEGREAWIDSSSRNAVNPPVVDGASLYVSASTPLDRRSDDLESFFRRC